MTMPTQEVQTGPSFFDRFAESVDNFASRAWFFLACVLLVVIWLPTFVFVPNIDTWQLLINTPTTVITFLLVALQTNTNKRADAALQVKLNAMADGLAYVLASDPDPECDDEAEELRQAVGLEEKEST